jgi:hypothetical protein
VAYFFYVAVVETSTTAERISGTELNFKKNEWIEIIRQKGSKEAYQLFLAEAPQNIEIDTHTQAHLFGEALYEVDGLDGISICDDSFAFGCYHSFLGSAIYYEGIETLPFFNQACKDKYGSENLPCQHGIGHGVLIYTGYDDLVGALDLCRTITDRPTGGCSSGVFMEYNFHTMESESVVGYSRPLTEDVFAPCSNLDSSYQPSCYLEQVQWWEGIFNRDYKKIGVLCEEIAEEVNRQACFHGVGNYIASFTMHDVQKILHLCTLMPSATGRAECHEGASWLIRGDGSFVDDARLLCDALSEPYRSSCNHKLS